MAVDNLVEGFAAAGVKPLRVAFGGKVKSSLFEHTLDHKLQQHPLKPEVDNLAEREQALRKEVAALEKTILDLEKTGRHRTRLDRMKSDVIFKERQQNFLSSKKYQLEQKMLRDILAAADVVSILLHSWCLVSYFADLHYVYHISS
jgi:hypothetical protein